MNPTIKLFFSAISALIISLLRFLVICFYATFKLIDKACLVLISAFEEILKRLK